RLHHEGIGTSRLVRKPLDSGDVYSRIFPCQQLASAHARDLTMWARIQNVYRLGIKELLGVRNDVVLVFLIAYSFTYSVYQPAQNSAGELANASVGIVDEDHTEASRRIRDAIRKPFALPAKELSVNEIDRAMDSGRFTFVIDIPPNFERDLTKGRW